MSYNKPFVLLHSWNFGFRGQWSGYSNSFCQSRLLTVTLQACGLPFNAQVMIPVGSSGFFNHASMYVDGCYLCIIIHYDMSWRDWGIRLALRGGRPDPESFKATDTYTYSKYHINSPHECLRMCHDWPYEGWVFIIILDYKWVKWFSSVNHMFV